MESDETLNIDKMRILGSIFWILGAITTFGVALKTYNLDLNKNH